MINALALTIFELKGELVDVEKESCAFMENVGEVGKNLMSGAYFIFFVLDVQQLFLPHTACRHFYLVWRKALSFT